MHRVRRKFEARFLRHPIGSLATFKRRRLTRPVFVGITGTAGKTTAKELTNAVLSCLGPGVKSPQNHNGFRWVARSILMTTQQHRFCVQEMGTSGPGTLDQFVRVFQPDIGVVLNVGLEHRSAFGTPDAVAVEKGRLVEALPPDGTAVLNADDARVLAMRERTSARVVTFGRSADADVRAENIHSAWPEPLRLDVVCDGHTQRVQTRLLGEHWACAVLAAFSVGRCLGVSPDDAAAAIAEVNPVSGRLDTFTTSQGASFLCDNYKFPYWNVDTFLSLAASAKAQRKLIVFGAMSDFSGNSRAKYRRIAQQALESADLVLFVGDRSARYLQNACSECERLITCETTAEAESYLRKVIQPGDLVILKGTNEDGDLRDVVRKNWCK